MHCSGIVIRNPCYLSRDIAFDIHFCVCGKPKIISIKLKNEY